ncbi:LysR family transcriptional regulator [Actinoallomurus rhizosphaericola]|uniref:LysR family transcriptional regulator n=1 Tax=Actinoallomurus rhizosphaericola TaxID=2952536 RepID=UPI002090B0B4|nr:LysR family transcriptional regulator [Actinoallomurus rhizosphaericola]MCO5994301.1 LysR family transcriptional regulator [Actinoallomurus rhizosphaericola]
MDSDGFTVDVRRLRVLEQVRAHGTIVATATALHLTPSAVSQQLSALARELGVPLVVKQGRTIRLTSQAEVLLEHAAAIGAQLERIRADLAEHAAGRSGTVRIGTFATAIGQLVGPALRELRQATPGLRVLVRESEPPTSMERLYAGDLDIVITTEYLGGPTRTDRRYHRVDLLVDPLDVVLPEDSPLAGAPEPLKLADLADEPWISGGSGTACGQITLSACAAAGFTPDVRHFTHQWSATLGLVAAGEGVELVPRMAIGRLPDGAVRRRLESPPARRIYAATRAGAQAVPHIRTVLDTLVEIAATIS